MSFFNKLFGSKDSLSQLRKAVQQKRWADALMFADSIDRAQLPAESCSELDGLREAAGDALAELNLQEAEACLRLGDATRAAEHFHLAGQQACSQQMRQQVEQSRPVTVKAPIPAPELPTGGHDCHSSCSSGCTPTGTVDPAFSDDLDAHSRWELLLATYPPALAERYAESSATFQQAVLAAHDGDEALALRLFDQVSAAEQHDLYFFERGAVLVRSGDAAGARQDFSRAVELNPAHLLALDALVSLEVEQGWGSEAEARLQRLLDSGTAPLFCHERLALLRYRRGDISAAAGHGEQALALGSREPQTIQLMAHLFEQAGNLAQAEAVLHRLEGGGGCSGGGGPVALAEFWLRHGTHLDKALESFKAAFRQEADNPRWALRIGQVYLAKGWKKEGLPLLRAALSDPRLESDLQQEGTAELLRAQGE